MRRAKKFLQQLKRQEKKNFETTAILLKNKKSFTIHSIDSQETALDLPGYFLF
jgi:hypothetical protein